MWFGTWFDKTWQPGEIELVKWPKSTY
jgi:hypothetical protein